MNIGIDIRSMFGTPTGVGRYTSNLLKHLSALDRENRYCLYTDHPVDAPIIAQPNFRQKCLTLPFAQNYFTWNHFRLPPELLRHPVDLFHFPFYTMPVVRNYTSVVTIHDITYEIHPEWYSWKGLVATRFFSRFAATHADKILTDSYATKRDILKYYGVAEAKVAVVYLAAEERFSKIDDRAALDMIRAKYQMTAPHIILYVGSIHTRRNIEQLVRAFARLRQKTPEVQLLLIGKREYPYLALPRLIEELGIREQVIFPGYVLDDDLPALYNLATLFVYPSSYEGFGLPPLEAMACGTPVITSNCSSLPEITGDAAIFITPSSVAEMADAMFQTLHDEKLRQEMIAKGMVQARKFSWERTAQETLAVYRNPGRIH